MPPAIMQARLPLEASSVTASLTVFGVAKSIHSNLPPPGGDYSITDEALHVSAMPIPQRPGPPGNSMIKGIIADRGLTSFD